MKTKAVKFLYKLELVEANRRALESAGRAIDPQYLERLPDDMRYPIFFSLPWERHGWVRCQIGTASSPSAVDYVPLWLDVPRWIYDGLSSIEVPEDEEVGHDV